MSSLTAARTSATDAAGLTAPGAHHRPGRFSVLGLHVSALSLPRAVAALTARVDRRETTYVCVTGVHGVIESLEDEALRAIHNDAGFVMPDGMPLVWVARLRGLQGVDRVYGPDLMLAVCENGLARGYRHFLYGGAPGVPELLADRLRERLPGLQIVGTCSPPFGEMSPETDAEIIETINRAGADFVWVGLSTPKQERWMASRRGRLNAPVLLGVGAAFDFHAGLKKQAPRWMQRRGLEWLFRLMTEPRRLWKRYLRANPRFLVHITLQLTGVREYR